VIRRVSVAAPVFEKAHQQFGAARSTAGSPSEYDFIGGPLAAATFAFRDFDSLSYDVVPAVRSFTVVDPIFGVVAFVAVAVVDGSVEVVDFADDPDYWSVIEDDPA
jgi:hypothetical protein